MFQKEFILVKQIRQKNVCFVTIGFLKNVEFKFEEHVVIGVMIY